MNLVLNKMTVVCFHATLVVIFSRKGKYEFEVQQRSGLDLEFYFCLHWGISKVKGISEIT